MFYDNYCQDDVNVNIKMGHFIVVYIKASNLLNPQNKGVPT